MSAAERRRLDAAGVALLGAALAALYALPIVRGTRTFLAFSDAREQTYAWFQKLARAWSEGYLPLWDANISAGHSFAGEIQSAVFYPLNWLWVAWFGGANGISEGALDALVLVHFALAAAGMYALLRRWTLPWFAAAAGAATFAFIGPLPMRAAAQENIFAGLCLAPWVVLFAQRYCDTLRARDALAAGAALGLQVLAGHLQPTLHTALIVAALALSETVRARDGVAARLLWAVRRGAPIAAIAALVALPQLLLAHEYLFDAYRWIGLEDPLAPGAPIPLTIYGTRYALKPGDVPALFDPWRFAVDDGNGLYFGTMGLVLVIALWRMRRDAWPDALRRHARWLVALAVFAFVAALGRYTFLAQALRHVPVLGQVRELGRYLFLFHFAISAIVACAFAAFARTDALVPPRAPIVAPRRWPVVLAAIAVVLQLAWMLRHDSSFSETAVWHLAAAIAVTLTAYARAVRPALRVALAGLLLVGDAASYRSVSFPARVAPSAREQFAGGAIVDLLDATCGRWRVHQLESARLPQNFADAHAFQSLDGYGATMYRPFFDFVSTGWRYDEAPSRMLGVRYVLAREALPLPLVVEDPGGLRLYEYRDAWPRVVLRSKLANGAASIPSPDWPQPRVLEYGDHVVRFAIDADADDRAIVSEVDYPGWCARVNGVAVPIARAAVAGAPPLLREVPVRKGENVIEFEYRPFRSMFLGCP